jgi:hypothetical protein
MSSLQPLAAAKLIDDLLKSARQLRSLKKYRGGEAEGLVLACFRSMKSCSSCECSVIDY